MSRLPTPGGDDGVWGDVLNEFLNVEHNADGSLKRASEIAAKYVKPSSGIPEADLDSSVQTKLNASGGSPTPDATSSVKGKVQLTNDLGGTADSPTVAAARALRSATTIVNVSSATAPTNGQVLTATSSTAAVWATPSSSAEDLVTDNEQTANYTLAIGDGGDAVSMNSSSATTVTIPPNSSVAFSNGTVIEITRLGAGVVDVVAGSGVTLLGPGRIGKQYASVYLRKRGTDEWLIKGGSNVVKDAGINVTAAGDTTVVAAVTGKKIRVIACWFTVTTANTLQWKSGSTALGGPMSYASNSGHSVGGDEESPVGLSTAVGQALVLNLTSSGQVSGFLSYIEE